MAKVKVRVLYPSAFAALGIEAEEEAEVEAGEAEQLVAAGYAEALKPAKAEAKTESTEEPAKRKPGRPRKTT